MVLHRGGVPDGYGGVGVQPLQDVAVAVTDPHRLEWENPANWRGGLLGVYVAPRDPRLWVPKKYGYGWTLNFAHRGSWYWLIGLIALPLLVVGLIALLTEPHP